ncbi:hypothetical protein FA13DRAFT_1776595 [Coprinellus micaceus]|uniref:Uncharacterized protein n=1 Tax=Coprinellus micaceus TaxID=71717 RepID=A0A4Y7SZD4_COPMI|nr:hypothetical protein FA13DRAFT_1776595 [Coprinellus micaceus]
MSQRKETDSGAVERAESSRQGTLRGSGPWPKAFVELNFSAAATLKLNSLEFCRHNGTSPHHDRIWYLARGAFSAGHDLFECQGVEQTKVTTRTLEKFFYTTLEFISETQGARLIAEREEARLHNVQFDGNTNINETQSFWFHVFVQAPKSGTLCERRVFNVSESVVTNASIFEWKIVAVNRPTAGHASIAYNGAITRGVEIDAYAACRGQDNLSEVILSTALTFSPLPGQRGPLLRNVRYRSRDPLSVNLMDIAHRPGKPVAQQLFNPSPTVDQGAGGLVETPLVRSVESGLYTYLATQLRVSTAEGGDGPAASVFDPWGFSGYNSDSAFDVFHVPGPSVLQTVYACRLLRRRSTGNLIVTVFVATAGMFTSGWAFFIFMARYFADRQKGWGQGGNECHRRVMQLNRLSQWEQWGARTVAYTFLSTLHLLEGRLLRGPCFLLIELIIDSGVPLAELGTLVSPSTGTSLS